MYGASRALRTTIISVVDATFEGTSSDALSVICWAPGDSIRIIDYLLQQGLNPFEPVKAGHKSEIAALCKNVRRQRFIMLMSWIHLMLELVLYQYSVEWGLFVHPFGVLLLRMPIPFSPTTLALI